MTTNSPNRDRIVLKRRLADALTEHLECGIKSSEIEIVESDDEDVHVVSFTVEPYADAENGQHPDDIGWTNYFAIDLADLREPTVVACDQGGAVLLPACCVACGTDMVADENGPGITCPYCDQALTQQQRTDATFGRLACGGDLR